MQIIHRISVLLLSLFISTTVFADRTVESYSGTINNFKKIDTVKPFFSSSYGYAVFPNIGKAGFFIGGSYGEGQVYRKGKVTGFSYAADVSIGFQLGGQVYSQVVFFQDKRAYDEFVTGNFEFSAQASAIAVTASVRAQSSTGGGTSAGASTHADSGGTQMDTNYNKGMLVFVLGKGGLMYEAAIAGQKYGYDPVK